MLRSRDVRHVYVRIWVRLAMPFAVLVYLNRSEITLKIYTPNVGTRTVVARRSTSVCGGVAVEDCQKRHSDMSWAFQTGLAIAFAQHTYLGNKIEWLGGSR